MRYVSWSKCKLIRAAQRWGRVRGSGACEIWVCRASSGDGASVCGGPPVPLIWDGPCALGGGTRSFVDSSGEVAKLFSMAWESCLPDLPGESARGMLSSSFPISSALSVIARFEEPKRSCRPLTIHAVTASMTTKPITRYHVKSIREWADIYLRNTAMILPTSTPLIGGDKGKSTKL